jgi:hypothetical protein
MSLAVNIGGVYKDTDKAYVNIGGVWKEIDKIFCNIGGLWKEGYASDDTTMWIFRWNSFSNKYWSLIDLSTGAIILNVNPSGVDKLTNTYLDSSIVSPIDGSIYYVGMTSGTYPNISKISKDGTHTVIVQSTWGGPIYPAYFGNIVIDFTNGYIYSLGTYLIKFDMNGNLISSTNFQSGDVSSVAPPILSTDKSKIRLRGTYYDGEYHNDYAGAYNTSNLSFITGSSYVYLPYTNVARLYATANNYVFNAKPGVLECRDFTTGALINSTTVATMTTPLYIAELDDSFVYVHTTTGFRAHLQADISISAGKSVPTTHGTPAIINITARNGYIYVTYSCDSNNTWWLAKYQQDFLSLPLIYDIQIPKDSTTNFRGHVMTYINK